MAVRPYALRASRFTRKALKDPYLTVPEEQVAMVSWTVDTSLDSLTATAFRGGLILFYIGISMSLYGKSNSASFSHFADQSKNPFRARPAQSRARNVVARDLCRATCRFLSHPAIKIYCHVPERKFCRIRSSLDCDRLCD